MSYITSGGSGGGGGGGTVTSITAGTGLTATPNPITGVGTIALTIPVTIADGGTNATSMTNTDGVVYYNGTSLVTTAVGSATQILTSNGAGVAPTFQPAPSGGITTIDGDTGSVTGSTISINANTTAGQTVKFVGSGTTLTFLVTDSNGNTFIGSGAGGTGSSNSESTAIGHNALGSIGIGGLNTAIGYNSLAAATSADYCVAIGSQALQSLIGSIEVIAIGHAAGQNMTSGNYSTLIGFNAGGGYTSSESSNICLGNNTQGSTGESNVLRIGNSTGTGQGQLNSSFIAGIQGITVSGAAVLVSSSDQLGVAVSSAKYKDNIQDMGDASSKALNLRPVTFSYKGGNDTHYGLIAEEVHEVLPELVVYDSQGLPQTVMYHELPAILLNELKKALKRIDILESLFL